MPADVTPSGLTNLRNRADQLGGAMSVTDAPGGGTALHWSVPLN
jgi:signal transduction histidine kinase